MKAWKLNEIGTIKYYEDVTLPEAKEDDEVIVKVRAAGICGSDIPRVYKNGAHKMPLIIGHEFSGEVDASLNDDSEWSGKRVGVFPLIPCKKCPECIAKRYEMCSSYSYLGSRRDGAFAEYVAVPKWNLMELPENVTYEQAAMLEPMAVAVHAMKQLNISQNDKVCVCGVGTIGQLLVMFLMERGIGNIYAIGNKQSQKELLINIGLPSDHYFDMKQNENLDKWVDDKTDGRGFDAYYECVGRCESVSQGFDYVGTGAQICLVGNPLSDMNIDKNVYWKILKKQLTIKGTWNSTYYGSDDPKAYFDDWHYVLNKLSEGKLFPEKLISHRLKLEELETGLQIMRDKSEDYCKIMVVQDAL